MTPRLTTVGVVLLLGGLAVLLLGDGGTTTALGLVLLTPGAALSTVAFVRGTAGPSRSTGRPDAASSANLREATETTRWPRVFGDN